MKVIFNHEKPVYDYSVSVKDLTRRLNAVRGEKSTDLKSRHVSSHALGLTETSIVRQYAYSYKHITEYSSAGRKSCIYLKSGTLTLTHKTNVFIARELEDYPCRKEKTLDHENRHVAIGKNTVEESVDDLRRELKSSASRKVPKIPLREKDIEGRMKTIQNKIMEDLRYVIKKMEEKKNERQAEIDTPENYKYESGLCPHEKLKLR